ncbi:TonB-dependent receptor plug domain-containing protein [Mucilaginibacter sp. AW1-3]
MKKNYVVVAVSLGLAQLGLQVNTGHAQGAKLKDTTKLNEVVITATRSPKKLSDIGRNVTVITQAQINQSQGRTVPDLLNNVAGITFSGANNNRGISSDVYLRGASAGNTLILVDGFPVNDASGIAGNYDLNAFPIDQIERIEILKGSNSTLYGSDAVAGVINIITKKPADQKLAPTIQAGVGSYKTYTSSLGLNGTINKTGIAVNISNVDYGGFSAATDRTGNSNFKNDGFRQRSVSINLTQPVSQKLTLNANLQTSYNTGDLPYDAFKGDNDYTYNKTFLLGGVGAKLALPNGALRFNVSQNNVWNDYQNLPTDNGGASSVVRNLGRITNGEAVLNQGLGKYFDITSGLDVKYSNTNQYSLYSSASFPNTVPSIINASTNIESVYTSLFFKSDIFHMELGGRYNHHNKYGSNFTYTINPSVTLANRFKIFASIGSAYVTPSLYQLYSQYGTPDLKPQTTVSYEAGFDLEIVKNMLSFTSDFFKRKTTDVIYFYSQSVSPYASYYLNGSKQDDQGFESELNFNYQGFKLSGYTAYVVGHQTDVNGNETLNLLRRPKNTYGANAAYQFAKVLTVGVNYKYTGGRFDREFLDVAPYSRVDELPSYNLFDLHLQYSPIANFSIFVDLKNLFDTKYVDWVGYNTMGFNVMSGLKYTFK